MKGKEGTKQIIEVRRMQCKKCHKIHRELPDEILPYLHYERDIVVGLKLAGRIRQSPAAVFSLALSVALEI